MGDGQTAGLLSCALANATALGLDDTQVAALARMHWGETPSSGIVAAMVAVMSENQFRESVSRFTEALQQQAPHDAESIESAVAAAIEKKIKDRPFVETELATAAAEKLLGWAKLFATFVAVPIGLLLLILSIFGISRFEDLRKVSVQADALVTEAQNRLTKGGIQFDQIRANIDDLTKQLNSSQSALETQLAQVKQFTTSNQDKIGLLTGTVNNLAGSVNGLQSATASLLLGASGKSVGDHKPDLRNSVFFKANPMEILDHLLLRRSGHSKSKMDWWLTASLADRRGRCFSSLSSPPRCFRWVG